MLELCHYPSSGSVHVPADLIHVALEVDDLDAFGKHASSLGYPWSDGPTVTESGTRFAFLDAPEGYEVEIIERIRKSGKNTP
jgi:lactoylglutathione lyase